MSTSKDNKIDVLEKAIDNIRNDKFYRDGIQFFSHREGDFVDCEYCDRPFLFDFESHSFRVKPMEDDTEVILCSECGITTSHKCDLCNKQTCDNYLTYVGSTCSDPIAKCDSCL